MTTINQHSPIVAFDKSAVIAISTTTSAEINLQGTTLCGLFIPATMTGTSLTFQVSNSTGGTFYDVRDVYNNLVTAEITNGDFVSIDPTLFAGIQFVKIVSSNTEAAERTIGLAARAV